MQRRPSFSSLPLRQGDPHHSAWGLWGPEDQLGTLNFLTEQTTLEAAKEIKDGVRVNLNWTFGEPSRPCFGRQLCEHKVSNLFVNQESLSVRILAGSLWTEVLTG